MKHIFSPDLGQRLVEVFGLLQQAPEQSAIEFLRTVLLYLSQSGERVSPTELKNAVCEAFEQQPNKGATMVEAFQPWIEMGEQRGLLQGRQEGRQETLQQLALKLLQHRFGVLAADMHAHILALPSQRLEALSEALLDFASLEDLSRWLSANPAPVSSVN